MHPLLAQTATPTEKTAISQSAPSALPDASTEGEVDASFAFVFEGLMNDARKIQPHTPTPAPAAEPPETTDRTDERVETDVDHIPAENLKTHHHTEAETRVAPILKLVRQNNSMMREETPKPIPIPIPAKDPALTIKASTVENITQQPEVAEGTRVLKTSKDVQPLPHEPENHRVQRNDTGALTGETEKQAQGHLAFPKQQTSERPIPADTRPTSTVDGSHRQLSETVAAPLPAAAHKMTDRMRATEPTLVVPPRSAPPDDRRAQSAPERRNNNGLPTTRPPQVQPTMTNWNVLQPPSPAVSHDLQKGRLTFETEISNNVLGSTDTLSTRQQAHALPIRHDLPQFMARQIAEALQHTPNRPVEISLSPEELGRVRLGLSTSESSILVTVLAERPETAELLRRHIAALETAFQELGYRNIDFAFANGGDAQPDSKDQGSRNTDTAKDPLKYAEPETTQLHLNSAPLTGIDVRI